MPKNNKENAKKKVTRYKGAAHGRDRVLVAAAGRGAGGDAV